MYNTTGSSINLSGYTLVPSTGSTVTLTGTIPANGFYVIGKNTSETSFEASWGVTIGGTSAYENSSNVLSTTSGVTFTLKNGGGTAIDNTTGYGITLGTRLYQCPVGSFAGNSYVATLVSNCTPGSTSSKSVDDLTHWTISRYNNGWDIGSISPSTGSDNLIIKSKEFRPYSGTNAINDVFLVGFSYIFITTEHFTISGELFLNSMATAWVSSSGSLTVTGNIYQERDGVNSTGKYNLWSTPFSNNVNIEGQFPSVNPCDLYTYNATTQEWKYDYSTPYVTTCNGNSVTITSANTMTDGTSDGNFDIGRGYFIPGSSTSTTRTLIGSTLNNGNINVPIYGSSVAVAGGNDWNLVGNPYLSGIQSTSFLSANSSLFNTFYIYNGSLGTYSSLNSSNSSGHYIASCQGFFLNATSVTDGFLGNLTFSNSMRYRANWFWRNDNQTIFLSLSNGALIDPIQIILDSDSQDGYDAKHDAFKLPNPNYFNLATYIDSELFVFNGIKPIDNYQTKTIKLFVETPSAGTYDINLDSLNLIDPYLSIKLEDKLNNTFTDLRTASFSFSTTGADSITGRFFIHLTNTVTSTEEVENNLFVSIYSSNGFLNVNTLGETPIEMVTIYDVMGRTIYSSNVKSNEYNIPTNSFQSGIYIVKVIGSNGKETMKRVFID